MDKHDEICLGYSYKEKNWFMVKHGIQKIFNWGNLQEFACQLRDRVLFIYLFNILIHRPGLNGP